MLANRGNKVIYEWKTRLPITAVVAICLCINSLEGVSAQQANFAATKEYLKSWKTFEFEYHLKSVSDDFAKTEDASVGADESGEIECSDDCWRTFRKMHAAANSSPNSSQDVVKELIKTSIGVLAITSNAPDLRPLTTSERKRKEKENANSWRLLVIPSSNWDHPDLLPGVLCQNFPDDSGRSMCAVFESNLNCNISTVSCNNRQCKRVIASDSQGNYAATIDPDSGEVLTVEWEKTANQLYRTKPVRELISSKGENAKSLHFISKILQSDGEQAQLSIGQRVWVAYPNEIWTVSCTRMDVKVRARPKLDQVAIKSDVPEKTPVVLMEQQQIKAQFRDGKIVRIFDGGAVENLTECEFRPANGYSSIFLQLGVVICLGVCLLAILYYRISRK